MEIRCSNMQSWQQTAHARTHAHTRRACDKQRISRVFKYKYLNVLLSTHMNLNTYIDYTHTYSKSFKALQKNVMCFIRIKRTHTHTQIYTCGSFAACSFAKNFTHIKHCCTTCLSCRSSTRIVTQREREIARPSHRRCVMCPIANGYMHNNMWWLVWECLEEKRWII